MLDRILRTAVIASVALLWSPCLYAWNFAGHKIASQIAWNELDEGARGQIVEILQGHPRYRADFEQEMPSWARNGTNEDRGAWLLQQAAVWPDIVRDKDQPQRREKYDRHRWHVVDLPLFLTDEDRNALEASLPQNTHTEPFLAADPEHMNVFQAINHNLAILRDKNLDRADRAVALCWVAHLTQDIHQPNHTMSLVVPRLLPRGDQFGTTIPIKGQGQLRSLHALWDAMVSEADSPRIIRHLAEDLSKGQRSVGVQATQVMEIDAWADENRPLAFKYVYTPELLEQILRKKNRLLSVEISQEYRSQAREVANVRIVQAGFRLAHLLYGL